MNLSSVLVLISWGLSMYTLCFLRLMNIFGTPSFLISSCSFWTDCGLIWIWLSSFSSSLSFFFSSFTFGTSATGAGMTGLSYRFLVAPLISEKLLKIYLLTMWDNGLLFSSPMPDRPIWCTISDGSLWPFEDVMVKPMLSELIMKLSIFSI